MRQSMSQRNPMRSAALAISATFIAGLLSSPLAAQVFVGAGVGAGVAMPAPVDKVLAVPAPPPAPTQVLRLMPGTLDGLKLDGETGELRWPVYLTSAQAADALRFRVGYVSAVSILPDTSKLTVRVNDREIGADVIDAPRGLRTVEFAIPAGLAHEGYNAISISVQQRHRVDCSVAATYELWTKIDPAETGLLLASQSHGISGVADLPALLPRADGSLPIHIVLPGRTNTPNLQRLIEATGAVAVAAHTLQPVVDFYPGPEDVYGIDLALGTRAILANNPRLVGFLGTVGSMVRVVPATATGRPILVVTGTSDAEVDGAIASISAMQPPKGTSAGLVAAQNYPAFKTDGDEGLALRDLGVHSEEFFGRFFRKSFNLMLPADFLASDYGRGTFDLAGGYAAGLQRGAQVRVDVNGKSSGIIKLPYEAGDVFRHNQLFLPLGLMRPGLNRVDVYAETPRPEDASCEASDAKRFLFLDSSEIKLPTLARVQRLPDLAVTTGGGLPFAQGHARLVVPKPDRETMGSALSITARAAVAAGKSIPFTFSTKMPAEGTGSTLVVAPARALDPAVMTGIGLDPAKIETAWHDVATQPLPSTRMQGRWWLASNDGPAACRLPSFAKGTAASSAPVAVPATSVSLTAPVKVQSEDLLESWTEERHPHRNWLASLSALATRAQDWVDAVPRAVHARFGKADRTDGIAPEASLILAQGMSRGSQESVTTIVTAPNSAILRVAVPCLFDPQVWSKVHGRLAVLDASSGTVTATDATSFHYVAGSRTSLGNARLVVAGWFSLDPIAFVLVAMLMALCLSGTTLWFVKGVGRRSE